MQIYGKSALTNKQMRIRKEMGFDKFELQLLGEMIGNDGKILPAKEVYDLKTISQYDIRAVHAPLVNGGDINLEYMVFGEKSKLLEECFYIAEYMAVEKQRDIILIVHTGTTVDILKQLGNIWNQLIVAIGLMLSKYPHVHLAIENIIPFRNIKYHNIQASNNFKFDNVQMAKEINEALDTNRVGTVLDTCHVLMTQRYVKAIYDIINDNEKYPMEDLSMEMYFKNNAETCKLIHLSGMDSNGIESPDHGAPFVKESPEKMEQLKEIVKMYKKYNYQCPVTLEVGEIDLSFPQNYLREKEALLSVL